MIHDIVQNSDGRNDIIMSKEVEHAVYGLRKFMYDNVYTNPLGKAEEKRAEKLISELFLTYMKHIELLPQEYIAQVENGEEEQERVVCDYIAGMTDRFAIASFEKIYVPVSWSTM